MRTFRKLVLAGLTAALLISLASGAAAANRLATNDLDFYAIWNDESQRLSFEAGVTIDCEVTLLGHFHTQTITKTLGSLIGLVDHVEVDETGCINGDAIPVPPEGDVNWHLTYEGFTGTLPNITGVFLLLQGIEFVIQSDIGADCIASADEGEAGDDNALGLAGREASGAITGIDADPNPQIDISDLPESNGLCDLVGTGGFDGTADVESGEGADLDITLV